MSRRASASPRRRRTSRPQLAGRDAFEEALGKITQLPAKTLKEDVASEYLPRFVAKLRELHYKQDDIVKTIVAMNLGVTERQIRLADSAWSKKHGKAHAASVNGSGGGGALGRASEGGPAARSRSAGAVGSDHAGLSGAGALKR